MEKEKSLEFKLTKFYKILGVEERTYLTLSELNTELENDKELVHIEDDEIGTYLHYLTQTAQANDDVSWRMVYSLSNAGIKVNKKNSKGNTALHIACMRGYVEIGFNFFEALFKVGIDPTIKNNNKNYASYYMEDIEQLNVIYRTHYPGILPAFEKQDIDELNRLLQAWVKVDVHVNSSMDLLEYACNYHSTNTELIDLLAQYKNSNNFIHSLQAINIERMKKILKNELNMRFNPNIADCSYIFTWYRPINRNLPKFLLECALDTKSIEIIDLLLDLECDVNLPHSNNADPLFFHAFNNKFRPLKQKFLKNANYEAKNQKGYNILFHLVFSYLKLNENSEGRTQIIDDIKDLLIQHPFLIYQRDQDGCTIIETIISMIPDQYKSAKIFIKIINDFIFNKIFKEKDFNLFLEFIYNSYGLILVNTKFDIENDENKTITVERFIKENNVQELKILFEFYFNSNFVNKLNNFYKTIKSGEIHGLKQILLVEKYNENLIQFNDYGGRSCLHLAVLYSHVSVLKFLYELDHSLIKRRDNLNRTVLHYAYGIGDKKMIEYLQTISVNTKLRDAKFLSAEDYMSEEIINDELFRVKNFQSNEIMFNYGVQSYLKCYEYPKLYKAIENNDLDGIKFIEENLEIYQMKLSDFSFILTNNEWINGEPYIPLLILSMQMHSFSVFQYILDNLIKNQSTYENNFKLTTAERIKTAKIRMKSAKTQTYLTLRNILLYLRDFAEQNEIHEAIDILDNLGEDDEIKAALIEEKIENKEINLTRRKTLVNNKNEINKNYSFNHKSKNEKVSELNQKSHSTPNFRNTKSSKDDMRSSYSQTCIIL